jgi:hypothetical protein
VGSVPTAVKQPVFGFEERVLAAAGYGFYNNLFFELYLLRQGTVFVIAVAKLAVQALAPTKHKPVLLYADGVVPATLEVMHRRVLEMRNRPWVLNIVVNTMSRLAPVFLRASSAPGK